VFKLLVQPSCRSSCGSGAPELNLVVQVKLARRQNSVLAQSASTQHPVLLGTQISPCGEHCPDWQSESSLWVVQRPSPSTPPQWPLLPHWLLTQPLSVVQIAPFVTAHVWVTGLHAPL
jgi:hypothetical protein